MSEPVVTLRLLFNGSASGAWQTWPGGDGQFVASGTFGGGTVRLEVQSLDGSTGVPVDSAGDTKVTFTSNGAGAFTLAPGTLIRAGCVGGSPSAIYASASKIPAE